MDQYIGKLLDNRYEILEVVGTGGMAVVYKARCHRLNRLVAVKILKSEIAQDEELRRRFHDESQAVAMLSHPNIVAVYDVSRSSDFEYIVMELIDGITLKQYMQQKGGALNWREALHFITQIMKALGHAHSRGIIHRDIKPHNIMVLKDGSVKVADFGIARVTASQQTLTQEALGSVHYISPEQARGSRIDARADIYSAGVVLYEMLTGRLPYEGDSPVSVAIQHINSVPLSPRELNPDIPEALEAITMKAMASSLERRYINADAMLADLEEFRKNPNINFDYDLTPAVVCDDEPTQVIHKERIASHPPRERHSGRERPEKLHPREDEEEEKGEEEAYYPERKPGRRANGRIRINPYYVGAVGAVLIFIIGIFSMLWINFFGDLFASTPEYRVPNLVGQLYEDVMTNPEYQAFTITVSEYRASDTVENGKILEQSPSAESSVKGERPEIKVVVSTGVDYLVLEDYTNQEYRSVLSALRALGLNPRAEQVSSETVTMDYVVSTSPAANSSVKKGDEVVIYYSGGPAVQPVTMISFIGETVEKAREKLNDMGLSMGSAVNVDSDKPEGTIVQQSIEAGQEVAKGTVINFQVSLGPKTTPTPPPVSTPTARPDAVQKYVPVTLPYGEGTVRVKVTLDGVKVYEQDITRSGTTMNVAVTGSGTQVAAIYFDDQFQSSYEVTFN